jgi:hypothetical protein
MPTDHRGLRSARHRTRRGDPGLDPARIFAAFIDIHQPDRDPQPTGQPHGRHVVAGPQQPDTVRIDPAQHERPGELRFADSSWVPIDAGWASDTSRIKRATRQCGERGLHGRLQRSASSAASWPIHGWFLPVAGRLAVHVRRYVAEHADRA